MTQEEGKAEIIRLTEELLRKIDGINDQVFLSVYKKKTGPNPVEDLFFAIEKRLRTFDFELGEDGVK